MAKAKKLPSGNWRVQPSYRDHLGSLHRESFTAKTKREAEFMAAEWLMRQREIDTPENITLGEAFDRFIENREAILSVATTRGYKQIRRYRMQSIMNTKLSQLRNEDIQKAINNDAKKLKPKTIRNGYGLLAEVLAAYRSDFKLRVDIPKPIAFESDVPTDGDFITLLKMAEGTMMYAVILLAACLGLRRSELCALTWDDVDADSGMVRINKAIVRDDSNDWVVKGTKTLASTRNLKIPPSVARAILSLPREGDRIIPVTPNSVTTRFIRLRNRLGKAFRLHDLRHYNASVMLALNIPDKYAMKRGGWSTPNTMKKVYQHTFRDKQTEVDETVNRHFEDIINPSTKDD